jgi:photosystem II stability/assembly factor-like uncharacterized protein
MLASAEAAVPLRFHQDGEMAEPFAGLVGTNIGDIKWSGRYLWVGTEGSLARLDPNRASGLEGADWVTFTEANGLGRGAISALDAVGDTVWVATLFDTTIAGLKSKQVGSGLSFSFDSGATWQHIPGSTIFDISKAGFERGPSTDILNACFGLAVLGDVVWATFFSGSSVRSRDAGRTWERVLPDAAAEIIFKADETEAVVVAARADSLEQAGGPKNEVESLRAASDSLVSQGLLHRTFEVLAYGDTVWIGTASGIARSFDGGATWKNIKARLDEEGNPIPGNIGANWVVSLDRQILPDGGTVIWAGTQVTDRGMYPGQINSISFSRDNGETWEIVGPVLEGSTDSAFAWNFGFTASAVWAATNEGLFASMDQGRTWSRIMVEDPGSRDRLSGVFVGLETVDELLWAGAETGLGRSADEGVNWSIVKSPIKTLSIDTDQFIGKGNALDSLYTLGDRVRTYAAPNPFAPGQDEQTRVHYSLAQRDQVTIKIYDFASRLVRTLIDAEERPGQGNHGENWDGRDDDGSAVANGVYFYRLSTDDGVAFGKVVVLD